MHRVGCVGPPAEYSRAHASDRRGGLTVRNPRTRVWKWSAAGGRCTDRRRLTDIGHKALCPVSRHGPCVLMLNARAY
jgi:hypothetical protein